MEDGRGKEMRGERRDGVFIDSLAFSARLVVPGLWAQPVLHRTCLWILTSSLPHPILDPARPDLVVTDAQKSYAVLWALCPHAPRRARFLPVSTLFPPSARLVSTAPRKKISLARCALSCPALRHWPPIDWLLSLCTAWWHVHQLMPSSDHVRFPVHCRRVAPLYYIT
jgi:hypothetical protein